MRPYRFQNSGAILPALVPHLDPDMLLFHKMVKLHVVITGKISEFIKHDVFFRHRQGTGREEEGGRDEKD